MTEKMETALLANVKKLYDHQLYECVIPAASLLSTLLQNDRTLATLEMEYQVMLYMSSANYKERHYRLACKQLEAVVLMHKTMVRFKATYLAALESTYREFADVELRYRVAVCYREMGEPNIAISTLQAVPAKSRTPKLNMMLARLLHHGCGTNKNEAALVYKEVLRDCPMSMKSIEALLELGIDGNEVNSLVVNAASSPKNIEWLSMWIKGHAQMYGRKHLEAAKTFQQLNDTTNFHQNEHLLTHIGKCLYYYGNFTQAEHYLGMVAMINPYNMDALCPLAVVYAFNIQKKPEHEKLVTQMTTTGDFSSEHWFILAQKLYMNAKFDRALSFTERALSLNPRNIEALLLRGKLFLVVARHNEAISAFRSAQCFASYRFEVYKGLFHCYVNLKRIKDAQNMCALAVRYFRTSPRSYTMFGRTLFHSTNPTAKKNAKKFVEKSLEIDEHYTPGVALMVEICQFEGATQEAIVLLKKQVSGFPHPKLFTMLGDLLSAEKELSSALHYYTLALGLEPTCQRALEGVNALGQAARTASSTSKPSEQSGSGSGVASGEGSSSSNSNSTGAGGSCSNAATMATPCGTPNHEWLLDCEETSNDALEMSSSPAVPQDDAESETFSEPFWQDVDGEITN
ncbi:anaphase-promoting complex subunit 7 [Scaptodrosophila lebanonensis]|uniref:Anaphase-promoting complex subunit 7 n=1 Tax=Drosophila lebanonensis TaxID=7225 RepID=A0A6J2UGL4_DROLE|nr:anaphase-promoting complex subunit 7 [Scaptodrosophila lebanonensis]